MDSLEDELENIKQLNSILELKSTITEAKVSDNLITKIDELSDGSTRIEFEGEEIVNVLENVILSFAIDEDNWLVDFLLGDSSNIETTYLGSSITIHENDITLNPFNNSPLTVQILIKTPVKGKFKIKIVGQDGVISDFINPLENYDIDHNIKLVGLYADYSNQVEFIFTNNEGKERTTTSISINTDPLPEGFPEFKIVKQYDNGEPNTVFLINYRPTHIPFMVDTFGKVRWYSTGFTQGVKYALQRLKNGNICFGKSGTGQGSIYEYTMLGELKKEYSFYPEFESAHHDVYEMPNGNFLVAVNKVGISTIEDHIIEIDRNSGMTTNIWDLREILPVDRFTLRFIRNGTDWFHNNAVIYDERDNSIIASGQATGVVKVSWDNELKWILAPPDGWSAEFVPFLLTPEANQSEFEWNFGQHAPLILPSGNLFLFDNGFGRNFGQSTSQYSRAVEYEIVEASNGIGGVVSQKWQYGKERGEEMFAPIISDVDYIENSDTRLIVAGSTGFELDYTDSINHSISRPLDGIETRIIEVNNSRDVLFEMTLEHPDITGSTYRAEKLQIYK